MFNIDKEFNDSLDRFIVCDMQEISGRVFDGNQGSFGNENALEGLSQDKIFMEKALEEARTAFAKDEIPVGAVIVCRGKIIARAHNLTETLNDPTAHAEMQAITAACNSLGGKYLDDCTLYVTLEPCVMCAGACAWLEGRLVWRVIPKEDTPCVRAISCTQKRKYQQVCSLSRPDS